MPTLTDSTVANNIHLLIFTRPTLEYANTWDGHEHGHARAHTHTNLAIHLIEQQGNLLHFEVILHNLNFIFHKMSFISQFYFFCLNNIFF
jgi:hypothetical protein